MFIATVAKNHKKIEEKWKKKWLDSKIFQTKNDKSLKKYYILEMFPYPSGKAAHVGHARNYVIGDSFARFMRMNGFNVLYPMGWDSFGLPSENAAIEKGIHPQKSVAQNIETMKKQFDALSLSYDWSKEITTCHEEYYKWNQWLFLKLYERGLAYKKKAPGNWCPECKTTLANEDVKDGKCWRCDTEIIQKDIDQWFFKITNYADQLLEGLDKIEWSEKLKSMQRNWIGRSEGLNLKFKVKDSDDEVVCFTTRPDTYFGITFMILAPEHPLVNKLVKGTKYEKVVDEFKEETKKMTELERVSEEKEKKGIFSGRYIINPVTKEEIPLWIANYVIMSYGTGVVMGVPTQDQRDFEFAKKYKIKMKNVTNPTGEELKEEKMEQAYTEPGIITNSQQFNGIKTEEAIKAIGDFLIKKRLAEKIVNYKIRDWCISRQRYWGTPIPIIYCEKCGIVPLSEKDLPLRLPLDVDFHAKVISPLATNKAFFNTTCPKCGGPAKRETDTMTTFVDSAWYFLRYPDPKNEKDIFDKNIINYWLPVDQYIGGTEHAVGHLMFSRFITKFLHDLDLLDFDEPFMRLLNQGMVQKGGVKMSKSKGNTIDPRDIIDKYGVDVLRVYLLAMAAPDKAIEWSDRDMQGMVKLLDRVVSIYELLEKKHNKEKYIQSITQKTIKKVTEAMKNLQQNKAILELITLTNELNKYPVKKSYKKLLMMLTPFAPHTCEEIWEKLGEKNLISIQKWPKEDEKLIDEKAEKNEESVRKTIEDVRHVLDLVKGNVKKIYIYVIPPEFENFNSSKEIFEEIFEKEVSIQSSAKPDYDPEGKAKRAKFGKPGIYVE